MIVRERSAGRLLCIRQTSHALMAADFCRHWGNADFAPPAPYAPVLLAIAQHDAGWFEWEAAPQVRLDSDAPGYPMDFMHGPAVQAKLELWRRGIARATAQHPYAGLLVRRHATLLNAGGLEHIHDPVDLAATRTFLAEWPVALAEIRALLGDLPGWAPALTAPAVDAQTRLLQFGDSASLQVCVPWSAARTLTHCPLDHNGNYAEIQMRYDDNVITFAPWPFGVASFFVTIHGYELSRRTFADHIAYRTALAAAPVQELRWRVAPG